MKVWHRCCASQTCPVFNLGHNPSPQSRTLGCSHTNIVCRFNCLHFCNPYEFIPLVTKQYQLVSVNGRWCCAAGKVSAGVVERTRVLLFLESLETRISQGIQRLSGKSPRENKNWWKKDGGICLMLLRLLHPVATECVLCEGIWSVTLSRLTSVILSASLTSLWLNLRWRNTSERWASRTTNTGIGIRYTLPLPVYMYLDLIVKSYQYRANFCSTPICRTKQIGGAWWKDWLYCWVYAMSNSSMVFSVLRRNELASWAERQSNDSEFQTDRALMLKSITVPVRSQSPWLRDPLPIYSLCN